MAARVCAAENSSRDGRVGIPVFIAAAVIGTVLPEDFDLPGIVSYYDDITVWVLGASEV